MHELQGAEDIKRLRKLGYNVIDEGNLAVSPRETPPFSNPKLKSLEPIVAICDKLAEVTERICRADGFPLVIGGDHSIALGSIAGVVKARGNIGVLWIDAHSANASISHWRIAHQLPNSMYKGLWLEALSLS